MYPIQPVAAAQPAHVGAIAPLTPVVPLRTVTQSAHRMPRDLTLATMRDALVGLRQSFPQVRELGPLRDLARQKILVAANDARHICQRAKDFLLREPSFEASGDLGEFSDYRQLLVRDAYLGANAFAGSTARTAMLSQINGIDACLATLQDNIDNHVLIRTARHLPSVASATVGDGRVALDRHLKHMDPLARAALMLDLAQEACRPAAAWQAVHAVMGNVTSLAEHIDASRQLSNHITDGVAAFDDRIAAAAHAVHIDAHDAAVPDDATRARLLVRYQTDAAFRVRVAARVIPVSLVLTDIASQQVASGRAILTAGRLQRTGVLERVRSLFGIPTPASCATVDALQGELSTRVASDDAITLTIGFLRATPGWVWPVSVPLASGGTTSLAGSAPHRLGFERTSDGLLASQRRHTPRADFADAMFDAMTARQRNVLGAISAAQLRLQLKAYASTLDEDALVAMLFEHRLP
jgi:hypothetical protein